MPVNSKSKNIKEELNRSLDPQLSDKESGEIYVNFALLYMKGINDINRRYERLLDSAIGILKDLKNLEKNLKSSA